MKKVKTVKPKKTALQIWIDDALKTNKSYLDTINDFKINDKEKISKCVAIAFNLLHRYLARKSGLIDSDFRNPWAEAYEKYISGNKNFFQSPQNAEVSYDFTDVYTELYNLYDDYIKKGKHFKIQAAEREFIDKNRKSFFRWIKLPVDIQRLQNIFNIFKNRQFTNAVLTADDQIGSGTGKTNFKAGTIFNNGTGFGSTGAETVGSTGTGTGFSDGTSSSTTANTSNKNNNQTENPNLSNGPNGQAEKKMASILAPFNKTIFNIDSQRIYKEISADRNYDFAEEFKQFDQAIAHLKNLKDSVDDAKENLTSLRRENLEKAKKKIQPAINSVIGLKTASSKILTNLHKVDFITERAAFNAAEKIINNMISAQSIIGNLGIDLGWAARPTWVERRISDADHFHRAWENIKNNTVRSSRLIHDAVAWNDARRANDYAKRMRKEWPGEEGEKRAKEFVELYTSKDPKDIQRCQQLVAELEERTDSKTLPAKAWRGAKSLLTKAKEGLLGKDGENTEVQYDLDEKGNRINFKKTNTSTRKEGIFNRIKNKFVKTNAEQEEEEKRKENKRIDKELAQAQKKREKIERKEKKKMQKDREAIYKEADRAFKKGVFSKVKRNIK